MYLRKLCHGFVLFQVAYASKDLKADVIVDLATLTGAQGVATGNHLSLIIKQEDEALVQIDTKNPK